MLHTRALKDEASPEQSGRASQHREVAEESLERLTRGRFSSQDGHQTDKDLAIERYEAEREEHSAKRIAWRVGLWHYVRLGPRPYAARQQTRRKRRALELRCPHLSGVLEAEYKHGGAGDVNRKVSG
jgi:hypothetical protein